MTFVLKYNSIFSGKNPPNERFAASIEWTNYVIRWNLVYNAWLQMQIKTLEIVKWQIDMDMHMTIKWKCLQPDQIK